MTTEVYLRPIEDRDVGERYLSWFRSAGVTQFLVARDLARDEVHQYVEEGRATGRWYMYAICDAENDLHIGNLKVGEHELVAIFTGKGPNQRDYRRGATVKFSKAVGAKYLELKITDRQRRAQPEFEIKDWE